MKDLGFEMDSLDIEVPVRLNSGKIKVFNVKDELAISEDTLTTDFMEQAGKYAWWAVLAETAKYNKEKMEVELDKAEAQADTDARKALEVDGIKITEGAVKQRIKLDENYLEAVGDFNKAKKNASILEKVMKAFEHRKDMLMVAGSHIRESKEQSGDLRSLKTRASDITSR